jgi:hypothetical protein
MDRELEWQVSEAVNNRYYEEIKKLRHELEEAGVAVTTEEGRKLLREAILKLNRSFFIILPSRSETGSCRGSS